MHASLGKLWPLWLLFAVTPAVGQTEVPPQLRALVLSSEGQPLADAHVLLCPIKPQDNPNVPHDPRCATFRPDSTGSVVVRNIQAGSYKVMTRLDGYSETDIFPVELADHLAGKTTRIVVTMNPN